MHEELDFLLVRSLPSFHITIIVGGSLNITNVHFLRNFLIHIFGRRIKFRVQKCEKFKFLKKCTQVIDIQRSTDDIIVSFCNSIRDSPLILHYTFDVILNSRYNIPTFNLKSKPFDEKTPKTPTHIRTRFQGL